MRIFHIYADGKTVKEIPFEVYRKMSIAQRSRWKFLLVWDNEMTISHQKQWCHIRRIQLQQVLKECWDTL